MTEPPNKLDELYRIVLKNGATRDRDEVPSIRGYALRGNAVRLFLAQRGRCFHCNQPMTFCAYKELGRQTNGFSLEHVIPKSQNGGMGQNIVLAHGRCNTKRGTQKLLLAQLIRRDDIWKEVPTYRESMIFQLARNMDVRGKKFDITWLTYKGGL